MLKLNFLAVFIFAFISQSAVAQNPFSSITLPAGEITFETVGTRGMEAATLWGDSKLGASAALVKYPANQSSPMHYHGSGYHAYVVSGGVKHIVPGQDLEKAPLLGPGSYWYQEGGENGVHSEHYYSEGPTVLYLIFEGPRTTELPKKK